VSSLLGSLSDTLEFLRMSPLSMSSSLKIGKAAASALWVTAAVGIIVLSLFVAANVSANSIHIDLQTFALICIGYLILGSFIISVTVRFFHRNRSLSEAQVSEFPFDPDVDAKTYVLAFNLMALFVLIVAKTLLLVGGNHHAVADYVSLYVKATAIAIVLASLIMLPWRDFEGQVTWSSKLHFLQRGVLVLLMSALFSVYVASLFFAFYPHAG
jgi:hypothetical protein